MAIKLLDSYEKEDLDFFSNQKLIETIEVYSNYSSFIAGIE